MGRFKENEIEDEELSEDYFLSQQLSSAKIYAEEISTRIEELVESYRYDKSPGNWELKERLERLQLAVRDLERTLE